MATAALQFAPRPGISAARHEDVARVGIPVA
jgi:hypothetical protein